MGMGAAFILSFVMNWFYGGLFETFWNGQTPGKRAMGIRVVTIDGQPITGLQAILRNVLRLVDGLPMIAGGVFPLFQLGLISCALNNRYQRLGDIASGTYLIFFFYLRKMLKHLDPSKVIPKRVRQTLDTHPWGP